MTWAAVAIGGATVVGGIISSQGQKKAANTASAAASEANALQYEMYQQQRSDLQPWANAGGGAVNALWGTPGTAAIPEQTVQGSPIYADQGGGTTSYSNPGYWEQQYDWESNSMKPVWIPPSAINQQSQPHQAIVGYGQSTTTPGRAATPGTPGLIQAGPGEFKESPSYQFALQQGLQGVQRGASATGRLASGDYLKDITKYAEGMASGEYENFLRRWKEYTLEPYFRMATMGASAASGTAQAAGQYGQNAGQNALLAGGYQAAGQLGTANTYANTFGSVANTGATYLQQQQYQNELANLRYSGAQYNPNSGAGAYYNYNQAPGNNWAGFY